MKCLLNDSLSSDAESILRAAHNANCYCGHEATTHVYYGEGCGLTCDRHTNMWTGNVSPHLNMRLETTPVVRDRDGEAKTTNREIEAAHAYTTNGRAVIRCSKVFDELKKLEDYLSAELSSTMPFREAEGYLTEVRNARQRVHMLIGKFKAAEVRSSARVPQKMRSSSNHGRRRV